MYQTEDGRWRATPDLGGECSSGRAADRLFPQHDFHRARETSLAVEQQYGLTRTSPRTGSAAGSHRHGQRGLPACSSTAAPPVGLPVTGGGQTSSRSPFDPCPWGRTPCSKADPSLAVGTGHALTGVTLPSVNRAPTSAGPRPMLTAAQVREIVWQRPTRLHLPRAGGLHRLGADARRMPAQPVRGPAQPARRAPSTAAGPLSARSSTATVERRSDICQS